MFSAKLYFESKNIKYGADAPQQRPLSLLVTNLKGQAAAWYQHLRDHLLRLRQNNFSCLEDYVASFRIILCKVKDMSDIDKVMHFQKGLVMVIRQEVKLRQFRNTTDAISFALMYDRAHSQQTYVEVPVPMEIGSSRFVSREECLRNNLCFYCKEPGHRLAGCRKRQSRNHPRDPSRQVQDDEEVLDSMQLNMFSIEATTRPARELLRFDGMMNGQSIRVLIVSGAERNIFRSGLGQHHTDATKVTAENFDGTTTPTRIAEQYCETLSFADRHFSGVTLIEWDVSANQDVILGIPWLVQFNPIINWQTGVMLFPTQRGVVDCRSVNSSLDVSGSAVATVEVEPDFLEHPLPPTLQQQLDHHVQAGYFHIPLGPGPISFQYVSLCELSLPEFATKLKREAYAELYHVAVKTSPTLKTIPHPLRAVLSEFADVFPDEQPVQQPPQRSIEHEVVLKQGAKPSNRAPFCLSKVEQEALDLFVADLLRKNWIQVSDSPWVSNIFGVPKKDPVTGKFPSRLEWLHSNNPNMPIR
ncbi:hypothetical protein PHMEG_00022318 [Phytophthora megakarya]|uniref:CCHC-type domain-containing protein n=1 Tax=Phytophthora megakarya TaxID=4795 RepID=A0A225VJ25_9STRA|nr:hypothetical protein PHMEG_00022318 [Phytophthora megakarya]